MAQTIEMVFKSDHRRFRNI